MASALGWPMNHSLAQARAGDVLEVRKILFESLQDHLRKIGITEGSTLQHLGMDDSEVRIGLRGEEGVRVHQDYAWFIVVEPKAHKGIV